MFYIMLIIGALSILTAVFIFGFMYVEKDFTLPNVVKATGALLFGVFLLVITLPSLKYILLKEYDVVRGECTIELTSSGRFKESNFEMLDSGDLFTFNHIPALDAYGDSIPYYCEVTVTKDHQFEIDYKIYDVNSRELILTSE